MFVNLTPHTINYKDIEIPASGIIARVSVQQNEVDNFPFSAVSTSYGEVENIPETEKGVYYIVSGMVFDKTNRRDVIAPDTGKTAIRNEKGHIMSVVRFNVNK